MELILEHVVVAIGDYGIFKILGPLFNFRGLIMGEDVALLVGNII